MVGREGGTGGERTKPGGAERAGFVVMELLCGSGLSPSVPSSTKPGAANNCRKKPTPVSPPLSPSSSPPVTPSARSPSPATVPFVGDRQLTGEESPLIISVALEPRHQRGRKMEECSLLCDRFVLEGARRRPRGEGGSEREDGERGGCSRAFLVPRFPSSSH